MNLLVSTLYHYFVFIRVSFYFTFFFTYFYDFIICNKLDSEFLSLPFCLHYFNILPIHPTLRWLIHTQLYKYVNYWICIKITKFLSLDLYIIFLYFCLTFFFYPLYLTIFFFFHLFLDLVYYIPFLYSRTSFLVRLFISLTGTFIFFPGFFILSFHYLTFMVFSKRPLV